MALPSITKTVLTAQDLDDIWLYIATDNIAAADAVLDITGERCQLLVEQPLLGRDRSELADGIRSFSIKNYTIFYHLAENGKEIVRVLHGARNIEKIF